MNNEVNIGTMGNNTIGLYLASSNSNGWVNMNRFHGGLFTGGAESLSGALYASIASHVYMPGTPYLDNGNEFLDQSLEWVGPDCMAWRIAGLRNHIRPGYMEVNEWGTGLARAGR